MSKSFDEMTNGERFEKEILIVFNNYLREKALKEFDMNEFLDAVEFTFKGIFDVKIANKLEAYCRFVKDKKRVGDYKICPGLKVDEIHKVAEENKIDYDFGICYFKYEDLDKKYLLLNVESQLVGVFKDEANFQFFDSKAFKQTN